MRPAASAPCHHLGLGWGVHQPGAATGLELPVVYGALYRRIPTPRLATPLDEIRFKQEALVYGVDELLVMWWTLELARRAVDVRKDPDEPVVRANDLLHEARGRLWLVAADSYGADGNRIVTVRLTRPVRTVLDVVRTPTSLGALRERLAAALPLAAVDRIDRLLGELLDWAC